VKNLALVDTKDGERRRRSDYEVEDNSVASEPKKKRSQAPEVGNALKNIYQRTIDEDIPPEMLDLLGKLG
jgi:hypothetical protein